MVNSTTKNYYVCSCFSVMFGKESKKHHLNRNPNHDIVFKTHRKSIALAFTSALARVARTPTLVSTIPIPEATPEPETEATTPAAGESLNKDLFLEQEVLNLNQKVATLTAATSTTSKDIQARVQMLERRILSIEDQMTAMGIAGTTITTAAATSTATTIRKRGRQEIENPTPKQLMTRLKNKRYKENKIRREEHEDV